MIIDSNDVEKQIELYKEIVIKNRQIVTVFMLTHNREKLVTIAIDAVLKQTYRNFQLIVLDNCSVDNTKNVICSISDPRLKYIYRASSYDDSNYDFCRLNCATRYFAIFHDDDIVHPDYLEKVLFEMESNSYAALSVSGMVIDEEGNTIKRWSRDGFDKMVWKDGEYLKQFFSKNVVGMIYPATIYRTDFYKDFLDFGGNSIIGPAADQNIWFQTGKKGGEIAFLNQELYDYRIHTRQDSNINLGFMDFQLMDYLITDEYFRNIVDMVIDDVYFTVWRLFKLLTIKYVKGFITEEKYKSIFDYRIIEYLSLNIKGKMLVFKMKACYSIRKLICFAYSLKKKLGINNVKHS